MSLAEARPDLVEQWHPTRNGAVLPGDVSPGTHRVVWWFGPCRHAWDSPVKQRTRRVSSGCPYCAGKRVLPAESFAALHPAIAGEWHLARNDPLRPDAVRSSSNKRVWWQCSTCHFEWATTIAHRTGDGTGCPACAGLVVVAGRSFADRFPDLAAEWHPSRNGDLPPTAVAPFSGKRVWWQCPHCGNEWQAAVSGRASGKGCSTCRPPGWSQVAIRVGAELAALLLSVGDLERAPREARREVGWEPDIALPAERIALDVDGRFWHGDGHHKTRDSRGRDLRKVQAFRAAGWSLVRIREAPLERLSPDDVVVADLRDTKAVTVTVAEHLAARLGLIPAGLAEYRATAGLVADGVAEGLIAKFQRGTVAGRMLAELFPAVAAEWHPTRNGVLRPETVFAGSGRIVWWLCSLGHEWPASMLNRSQGSGCPYCSGNKAGQGNTLIDLHPELAAQWHPARNGDLTPTQVTPGTTRKAWWRCSQGHEWQASIASRVAGRGCSQCSGRVASPERNLLVVDPGLAAEWHPSKNGELTPADVTPGSGRKAWWLCAAGHEWDAAIVVRRSGDGCPYCSRHRVGQGNSFANLHPDLAAQWHPTLNQRLTPADVSPRSHQRAWWLCTSGHTWAASVGRRVDGAGCPHCSGRRKARKPSP